MDHEPSVARLVLILLVAVGSHVAALTVRWLGRRALGSRIGSEAKVLTITGFVTSSVIFTVYFAAIGFALQELGVSLTTYLASASIIGLAVSFGSQGVVQDVISGLTVVFSNLLDVGDMVEIGGQVGVVEKVHMRFTVLTNFSGARVNIPNRSISNVIRYPDGYISAFMDVRLPADRARWPDAEARVKALADAAFQQFPGVVLRPPTVAPPAETEAGYGYIRCHCQLWPGQTGVIEQTLKSAIVQDLRGMDERYADWMVAIQYRSVPPSARRRPLR